MGISPPPDHGGFGVPPDWLGALTEVSQPRSSQQLASTASLVNNLTAVKC
jgi:hypothetical protein